MAFLNQCNFFGNVGRNAEHKTSKDGTKSWAEFNIGVSVGSSNNPKTMWVKCLCFGKLGERALQHANKGAAVYVSGKIDVSAYIGKKNNEAMVNVSLLCNDIQIMKTGAAKMDDVQYPAMNVEPSMPVFDEEIPF
jgi:single-stranded DNA-binding protein